MTNPYATSDYAHERVGFDLHCEPRPGGYPIEDGDIPKCAHCGNEYEHSAADPHPCIERIAEALEEARARLSPAVL